MEELRRILSLWNIDTDDHQLELFEKYYRLLIEWNDKINLTAITEKKDVIIKHFCDSIALLRYMDLSGRSLLDVGTGAGFPGIPLKIMCPDCDVLLLDSLNKRTIFLNEVITELGLLNIRSIHGRAEDLAHGDDLREKFDIVVSRAVANLSTLSEYCLPFVNNQGYFISYKGGNVLEEIEGSEKAIRLLGGVPEKTEKFILPEDNDRSLIFIKKTDATADKYPRKAGIPSKKPL